MKSKLIISIGTLCAGGAERVISNLSYHLADQYDDVVIVMWYKEPIFYKVDGRVRIVCVEEEVGTLNDIKRMLWFRRFIKSERPDLLLSFLEPLNLRVLIATIGLKIKTVVAERNDPRVINGGKIMDFIERTIYKLSDGILVQTETIKKFFIGGLEKKTTVIYNPVNIEEDLVGKALLTPKKKLIVSVARLKKQKNQIFLVKSFQKFLETHSDYKLIIYGEGPEREYLEQYIKANNLLEHISLPGATKNVLNVIVDADCFVLSSRCEGMSNALLEAMCIGLPCISTKVSGAIDLIEDNKNGILVDHDDVDALSQSISRIVDDEEFAKQIGKSGTELYKILKSDVISKQWIEYINKKIENQ